MKAMAILCPDHNNYKYLSLFICTTAFLLASIPNNAQAQSRAPVLASAILNINNFVISNSGNNMPLSTDTDFSAIKYF